jgi:hypothetical protein
MSEIVRRRTIRPSTRKNTSVNYRVAINSVGASDLLVVEIRHESKSYQKSFRFRGIDILKRKSLGFKVSEVGGRIEVTWISTQPING